MHYTYQPATLPLNRKKCPFELVYAVREGKHDLMKMRLCNASTWKDGWCQEHHYVESFLQDGASLGWPALRINEALSIGRGIANWEAYAVRLPKDTDRLLEVRRAIAVLRIERSEWKEAV